jgi:hypothetical protein
MKPASILFGLASAQDLTEITCPTLKCVDTLDMDTCWVHDGEQPMTTMYAMDCNEQLYSSFTGKSYCEFDPRYAQYTWLSEQAQSKIPPLSTGMSEMDSPLYQTKTQA